MESDHKELLNKILNAYYKWYDITLMPEDSGKLAATGTFHEHGMGYTLVKKAETWSMDRYEYVYYYSVPHFSKSEYDELLAETLKLGEPLVNPVAGHMSTNLVAVVLYNSADPDALEAIKKTRLRKSFQFSLKGWMEVQFVGIEVGKSEITANPAAYNSAKFLKSILQPKAKKNLFLREKKKK